MTHPRQTIRESLAAILIAADTAAGTNVEQGRTRPIDAPGISVNTPSDRRADEDDLQVSTGERDVRIEIEVAVKADSLGAGETIADRLDALCKEVEDAISADGTLGGACTVAVYVGTETSLNDDVDPVEGSATIEYTALEVPA